MAHILEPAASGRSKCRGCGRQIVKDDLRFGERLENPFAEGEMTLWFHPLCAAYKRPESVDEIMVAAPGQLENEEALKRIIRFGIEHRRTQRINGLERAPSGRARCRSCREMIGKDVWRIPLVFFEEGVFNPSGFVHVSCSSAYFETTDIIDRLEHFSSLATEDLADVQQLLA